MTTLHDVIIVGGGPAGLQAALTLGRMHRDVVVFDSGSYRNGRVAHMHNFLTNDGTPPAEFRERARAELAAYATVTVREAAVGSIEQVPDGFRVLLGEEAIESRLVVLATGVRDEMPPIPGLETLWGTHAYACPFCHGHELSGRDIGVLAGPAALHLVGLLAPIGKSVTVFSEGAHLEDEQLATLAALGATLRTEPVAGVSLVEDRVRVEVGDAPVAVAGLFVGTSRFIQSAPFAEQLGLDLQESGCIAIDDFGRTSLPGVLAAGDLAHRSAFPMPLASVLAAAAAGQMAALACVQELISQQ